MCVYISICPSPHFTLAPCLLFFCHLYLCVHIARTLFYCGPGWCSDVVPPLVILDAANLFFFPPFPCVAQCFLKLTYLPWVEHTFNLNNEWYSKM